MATLIRPPPNDPAISSMENTLELTQLTDIDPVRFHCDPFERVAHALTSLEHFHQHETSMAPAGRAGCIWRRRHCSVPCSRTANRSTRLLHPFNALLLCPGRQLGNTHHIPRRARQGWQEFRYTHCASTTTRKTNLHRHPQLHEGIGRKGTGCNSCCQYAPGTWPWRRGRRYATRSGTIRESSCQQLER